MSQSFSSSQRSRPGTTPIRFADGWGIDAFHRVRVSNPTTEVEVKVACGYDPLRHTYKESNGGTVTFNSDASATLAVTAAAGSTAILQSRQRGIYQAGKGLAPTQTFVLGAPVAGITKYVGYFDSLNGLMLRQQGDGALSLGRRKAGGTTWVPREDWSESQITGLLYPGSDQVNGLDVTKSQIFGMDLQLLLVGRARFAFDVDGRILPIHNMNHANRIVGAYIDNPNLPLTWMIESDGTNAGSMLAVCGTVISDGGVDNNGTSRTADTGVSPRSLGATREELIAIRLKSAFTRKAMLSPTHLSLLQTTGPFKWELVVNAVGPAGGVWSPVTDSYGEANVGRTGTVTAGTVLKSGFVSTTLDVANVALGNLYALAADVDANADTLSLVVTNLTGADRDYSGAITYNELS